MESSLNAVNSVIESYSKQIADSPSAVLYLRRSTNYATVGEHDKAVADTKKALELDPNLAEAHNNLAALLIHEGKYVEAEKAAKHANELDAEAEEKWWMIASEGARLTKKIKSAPTAALLHKRGVFSLYQSALKPAKADLQEATRLDPNLASAYSYLAEALIKLNEPLEAEKVLDDISDRDPDFKSEKIVVVKRWVHLIKKTEHSPTAKAYHELTRIALAQESTPTLLQAEAYRDKGEEHEIKKLTDAPSGHHVKLAI